MLATLIIVFREVIEAGLIVGIVLAVTRGVAGRIPWIIGGIGAGVAGALALAGFAGAVAASLSGNGQEIFNAAILAVAVVMLAWHNIWMSRHGRQMAAEFRTVGSQVASGARSLWALALVIGVAVLREGSEVVLFLYGIAVSDGTSGSSLLIGGLGGILLGAGVSGLTYLGLVAIPPRMLFGITGGLIAFLAAGMAAQSVAFLEQAGLVTVLGDTLWDTSWILEDKTILGRVLHTLVGYMDRPSILEGLVYLAALVGIWGMTRALGSRPAPRPALVPSQA